MPRPALARFLVLLLASAAFFALGAPGLHALRSHGCTDTSTPAFRCVAPHLHTILRTQANAAPFDLALPDTCDVESDLELAHAFPIDAPPAARAPALRTIGPAPTWPLSKGPPTLLRLHCALTT